MNVCRSVRIPSDTLERRFREERLGGDAAQLVVVTQIAMVAVVVFSLADLVNAGPEGVSKGLFVGRGLAFAACWGFIVFLRRPLSVRVFDAVLFAWMVMFALELLLVNSRRPDAHALNAMLDIMAIIAVYVVIPAPLLIQVIPTFLASAGYLALWWIQGAPPDTVHAVVIVACFVLSHAWGILGSVHNHRLSRGQFMSLLREQEARQALERAMEEIKALQGIIPICAYCRKVRSDEGFWEQVEAYVGRRTGAGFSHGICPSCADEQFPEVFKGGGEGAPADGVRK